MVSPSKPNDHNTKMGREYLQGAKQEWHFHNFQKCRNPSFGLATKAKGLQRCRPRGSPGVTSHTLESVRKCEEVNPHTPKATPTLEDVVLGVQRV
jgi:hypothetical protein